MSNKKMPSERHTKGIGVYLTAEEYELVQKLMDATGQRKPSRFFMTAVKRLYNRKSLSEDWATKQIIFLNRQRERIRQRIEELKEEEKELEEQLEVLEQVVNDEKDDRIQSERADD